MGFLGEISIIFFRNVSLDFLRGIYGICKAKMYGLLQENICFVKCMAFFIDTFGLLGCKTSACFKEICVGFGVKCRAFREICVGFGGKM